MNGNADTYQMFTMTIVSLRMVCPMYWSSSSGVRNTTRGRFVKLELCEQIGTRRITCRDWRITTNDFFHHCFDVGKVHAIARGWQAIATNDRHKFRPCQRLNLRVERHTQYKRHQNRDRLNRVEYITKQNKRRSAV